MRDNYKKSVNLSNLVIRAYHVRARDEDGNVFDATVRADSPENAEKMLRDRGLYDTEVEALGPLEEEIVSPGDTSGAFRNFVAELRSLPRRGKEFGRSIAALSRCALSGELTSDMDPARLPAYSRRMFESIRDSIADTGRTPVLHPAHIRLRHLSSDWRIKVMPPFVLLFGALAGISFLCNVIAFRIKPAFAQMFLDFGIELPDITMRWLQWGSAIALVSAVIAGVFFLPYLLWAVSESSSGASCKWWKIACEKTSEFAPLQGWLFKTRRMGAFYAALAQLIEDNVPAPAALEIAAALSKSPWIAHEVGCALQDRDVSENPQALLGRFALTAKISELATGGYDRERLSGLLDTLADGQITQIDALALRMQTITVPIVVVFAVIFITSFIISMFSPLVKLMQELG